MRKLFTFMCFVLVLIGASLSTLAQRQVSGTVTDASTNDPVPFVNVVVKNSSPIIGVQTDFSGNYSLNIPGNSATLVFSCVGYEMQEIAVNAAGPVNVSLKQASVELQKVTISAGRRKERALDAPAAINTIEAREIRNTVVATPSDYLKNANGIDIVKTGMMSANVTVRGFNNIFSGAVLNLVDYRIASVPSLRVNTQQMIPATPYDIQRIEVLKGPAAAMYGPNSTNGVVHIITESPLDMKERNKSNISLGFGVRAKVDSVDNIENTPPQVVLNDEKEFSKRLAYSAIMRNAGRITTDKDAKVQVAYKISGKYFAGNDWHYDDPFEPSYIIRGRQSKDGRYVYHGDSLVLRATLDALIKKNAADADPTNDFKIDTVDNSRNFEIQNYNFEGRLDFRFNKKVDLVLAAGHNNFSGIEMTGIGSGQAKGWTYTYGQARVSYKRLFAQVYMNASNSGETYLFRSGDDIIDRSKFISGQIQHGTTLAKEKLNLVYGIDALLTRPNTDGTIHGRNEDDDDITEIGAYAQADYAVTSKLNLIAALRVDKHNFVEDVFLSPRAAVVFKPNTNNTLRATYNRAFSSPSALNTSLDILSGRLPTGIGVRAVGNRNGFTYDRNAEGTLKYVSPFYKDANGNLIPIALGDPAGATAGWNVLLGVLADNLAKKFGGNKDQALAFITTALPKQVEAENNMIILNTSGVGVPFDQAKALDNVEDFGPIKNSVTQTIELGYKGIIKNKLALTVDVYRTQIDDFVSALLVRTPSVFLDRESLYEYLLNAIDTNLSGFKILRPSLDGLYTGGVLDGHIADDLAAVGSTIPYGTVTTSDLAYGTDILLTYRNFGSVSVFGAELGAKYYLNKNITLGFNYAWVNKEEFETEGVQLALNAPGHKVNLSVAYTNPDKGIDVAIRHRWQDAFVVNSGVYVGQVSAGNWVDLDLGYGFGKNKATRVGLCINNLLNNQASAFVGAPKMGMFTMLQLSHQIGVD
ncbi:MAG: TonB-dependent receptor [Sphingobacteriales bacterium]|nr:TonB-dependent receptor [Sphingobacteriales bacterium]MBP9142101.1 TonB-dependent receptor [Chitinophagales bacterium]MBK6889831.1 TonB-dependent receptor [Sphingobacteriales bacterium]MBK7527651.1 TonB-dependent receptor [Sphingobacteriales bacterium]MBK8678641.1 TonB-dependent receptor [Sphingobacteriales bacterium]